jgi:hypothetical protein
VPHPGLGGAVPEDPAQRPTPSLSHTPAGPANALAAAMRAMAIPGGRAPWPPVLLRAGGGGDVWVHRTGICRANRTPARPHPA